MMARKIALFVGYGLLALFIIAAAAAVLGCADRF